MFDEDTPSAKAMSCKERGNQRFKVRDDAGALRFYTEGLSHLQNLGSANAVPPDLAATLHANSAQVLLRQRRWLEAIEQCNSALQHDPMHAKAAWRGATAAMEVGMRDVASALVESSLIHNPHCAELLDIRNRLGPSPEPPFECPSDDDVEIKRWMPPAANVAMPPRSSVKPPPEKDKAD